MGKKHKIGIPCLPLAVGEGAEQIIFCGHVYTYEVEEYQKIKDVDYSLFPESVDVNGIKYFRMSVHARGVYFLHPVSGLINILVRIPYGQKQDYTDEEVREFLKKATGE